MIKKLFLFTLLVSSFLVISCSNEDTTGSIGKQPIGTGIDSKYAYMYAGDIEYGKNSGTYYPATLTVNSDGSAILEYTAGILGQFSIDFKKEEISFLENKNGYDTYIGMRDGVESRSFVLGFNSTSAIITLADDGGTIISGTLTR